MLSSTFTRSVFTPDDFTDVKYVKTTFIVSDIKTAIKAHFLFFYHFSTSPTKEKKKKEETENNDTIKKV